MITFDSDFEGGSLDRAIKMGENWYHLKLRPDTWYYFSCRIRGCKGKNIIFEITCGDNCNPFPGDGSDALHGNFFLPGLVGGNIRFVFRKQTIIAKKKQGGIEPQNLAAIAQKAPGI